MLEFEAQHSEDKFGRVDLDSFASAAYAFPEEEVSFVRMLPGNVSQCGVSSGRVHANRAWRGGTRTVIFCAAFPSIALDDVPLFNAKLQGGYNSRCIHCNMLRNLSATRVLSLRRSSERIAMSGSRNECAGPFC